MSLLKSKKKGKSNKLNKILNNVEIIVMVYYKRIQQV